MNKEELQTNIVSSLIEDWEYREPPKTWVNYRENIKIQEVGCDGFGNKVDIEQPDFVSLPDDEHDQETEIRVEYQGIPFDQQPALVLDGGRITMVKPEQNHSTGQRYINEYQYVLSEIMSTDDFSRKCGSALDVEVQNIS